MVHLLNVITSVTSKFAASACLDAQASRKIVVLLAAYNGAHLVGEQIRSIQRQTVSNWTLFVRDDCSEDNTRDVLAELALEDRRIRYVRDARGHLGAAGNFGELMRVALEEGADTIFFSDQDDVWSPDKIATQLQCLNDMESEYGTDTPLLSYSDLEVVDENLLPIHPSFMQYQRQSHEYGDPIHVLLIQNIVAGCSVAINRPLLELAVPVPSEIILHDWWLAVCTAACGRIGYIDQPLVRYRQHAKNHLGAVRMQPFGNFLSKSYRKRLAMSQYYLHGTVAQAAILKERIAMRNIHCSAKVRELLHSVSVCLGQSRVHRLWTIYRLPLRRQGLVRKLVLLVRLLVVPPEDRKQKDGKDALAV